MSYDETGDKQKKKKIDEGTGGAETERMCCRDKKKEKKKIDEGKRELRGVLREGH